MREYRFDFAATVVVQAENAAQAQGLAKSVRLTGSRVGSRRPRNNRDAIGYSVTVLNERISRRPTHDT